MDELTLDNKKYLSSKRAAQVTGYAKDYIGQLCREGRIEARLVGRNWYVLEDSVLEHRFGAEESKTPAPVSVPQTPVSTWEAPTYTPESITLVPEIQPKPVPAPAKEPAFQATEAPVPQERVLKDMQSAWQEWFDTQKKEEQMLPDASEMLLEAAPEESPVPPQEPLTAVEEPQEPQVHIERIDRPSVAHIAPEEPVVIRRASLTPRYEAPVRMVRPQPRTRVIRTRGGGSLLLRAIFVAAAGIAIAVTVIGSGFIDTYFEHGASSSITDTLGGINKVSK
jgi:hypothetical protein